MTATANINELTTRYASLQWSPGGGIVHNPSRCFTADISRPALMHWILGILNILYVAWTLILEPERWGWWGNHHMDGYLTPVNFFNCQKKYFKLIKIYTISVRWRTVPVFHMWHELFNMLYKMLLNSSCFSIQTALDYYNDLSREGVSFQAFHLMTQTFTYGRQ